MADYQENRTTIVDRPGGKPVVTQTGLARIEDSERRISNGTIAGLVIAGILVAVLITYLVTTNQRQSREAELAREQNAQIQAQPTPAQPLQQPPVIINVPPQTPPAIVLPAPAPAPYPTAPPISLPVVTNASLVADITAKLLDDNQLTNYSLNATVDNGVATLTGEVPYQDLKARAEKVAKSIKGVTRIVNDIIVRP